MQLSQEKRLEVKTLYKLIGEAGGTVIPINDHAICFHAYRALPAKGTYGKNTLKIYLHKAGTRKPLTTLPYETVKHHISGLSSAGFPCLLEEDIKLYIITVKEENYLNKTHVRIAIDFIRLLWEGESLIRSYKDIPPKLRQNYDYFSLIQALSCYVVVNHHSIASRRYNCVIPAQRLLDYLRKNRDHSKGTFHVYSAMRDECIKDYGFFKSMVGQAHATGQTPDELPPLPPFKPLFKPKVGIISSVCKIIRRRVASAVA